MEGIIKITNQSSEETVIDIEGVIGVPEERQFDDPGQRVATYETFRSVLDNIRKVDSPRIIVNIRSTGGNVNDALLIFDALSALGANITTRCFGYVASAATIIAQAASAGQREISANSLYLIHRSVCATEGNAGEMERTAGMLGQTDGRIAAIYAGRSGKPESRFTELMGENGGSGRWLAPEETIALGLADTITGKVKIAADAAKQVRNLGLPAVPGRVERVIANLRKKLDTLIESLMEKEGSYEEREQGTDQVEVELPENVISAATDIAYAQANIATLEARDARLTANATATLPKEDPSPQHLVRTANEEAYAEDVRRLR